MNMLYSQFGLDKIPTAIKKVTNYVPHKVDELLRKLVKGFLGKVGSTTTGKASSGRLTEKDAEFKYKTKDFELTVVEGGAAKGTATGKASVTQLRIVHKSEGNKVHALVAEDFNAGPEKDKFDAVMLAANNLQKAAVAKDRVATTKSAKAPAKVAPKPKGVFNNLLQLQQTLTTALNALKSHLQELGCKYLNAGCFAAGTKLWTPGGYRAIETLVPGELVYSRDEWNPNGAIEAKVIEEVFTRFAGVYNIHLGGQVIGTSGEHPFYVETKGWTAANELKSDDRVLCADGSTVRVEEVFETGEWESVYNLRVADHHTYFVGEESWGWAAWVHNAYLGLSNASVRTIGDGYAALASGWWETLPDGKRSGATVAVTQVGSTKYVSLYANIGTGNQQFTQQQVDQFMADATAAG